MIDSKEKQPTIQVVDGGSTKYLPMVVHEKTNSYPKMKRPMKSIKKVISITIVISVGSVGLTVGLSGDKMDYQVHAELKLDGAGNKKQTVGVEEELLQEDEVMNVTQDDVHEILQDITPTQLESDLKEGKYFSPMVQESKLKELLFLTKELPEENINQYMIDSKKEVIENIREKVGTKKRFTDEEVNSDIRFTSKTEPANKLAKKTQEGRTLSQHKEIISLREDAYKVYETRGVANLLAQDYNRMLMMLAADSSKNDVFLRGMDAIHYFNEVIAHSSTLEELPLTLYSIAQVYYTLGNISNLEPETRKQMFVMAEIYFDMAIDYANEESKAYYYTYYNAMSNHKLAVLIGEGKYEFLIRAEDKYQQTVGILDVKEAVKRNSYKFLGEIEKRLMNYLEEYGHKEGLKTYEEYQQKRESALNAIGL